jgi:hypothetical protein
MDFSISPMDFLKSPMDFLNYQTLRKEFSVRPASSSVRHDFYRPTLRPLMYGFLARCMEVGHFCMEVGNCLTQPSKANKQSKQASKQTSKLAWVSLIIA